MCLSKNKFRLLQTSYCCYTDKDSFFHCNFVLSAAYVSLIFKTHEKNKDMKVGKI